MMINSQYALSQPLGRIFEAPIFCVGHPTPGSVRYAHYHLVHCYAIVSGVRQSSSKLGFALTGETILQMSPHRGLRMHHCVLFLSDLPNSIPL